MQKQSYVKGAVIISVGGFISKLLGAAYRVPLIAILGGKGMGIYQMVYPLYCILLTVSASGIPAGIARLISSGKVDIERQAFKLYGLVGLIGSVIMFASSNILAILQGEPSVQLSCKLLSPSVFLVSILSIVRGYYQGKGNMYPTAVTEVCEQAVKVAAGIALAIWFRHDTNLAVAAAVFAVTLSELISTLFALSLYISDRTEVKPLYKVRTAGAKAILKYTVPLTLTAIAIPTAQLLESIIIVAILRGQMSNATAIYGIYSGCAVTIVNLPVSLTYGLAAASVPQIAPLWEDGRQGEAIKKAEQALLLTLLISLPCAAGLYLFVPIAARMIFGSLSESERGLLILLVRIMSINAVTLSLQQTSSACLTSLGKPIYGTISGWTSCTLRVLLSAVLIKVTNLSIIGGAISANCCYLVAVLMNIWYIIYVKNNGGKVNESNIDRLRRKRRSADEGS